MQKALHKFCVNTLIISAITFFLVELGLRAASHVIPPHLLIHFHPEPRKKGAMGRFQLEEDTVLLARDDNGPPLRLVKPLTELHWYDVDGRKLNYSARVDNIGFCNPPDSYDRTPSIDLISIGDSFTFCIAVNPDKTWTANVGRFAGLSTYNLGKTGVGLYEYLQILKKFGINKRPRFVVLAIYGGNDLRDAAKYQFYKQNVTDNRRKKDKPSPLADFVLRRSYAANLLTAIARADYLIAPTQLSRKDIDFRYRLDLPQGTVAFNEENTDKEEVIYAKRFFNGEVGLDDFNKGLNDFVALSKEYDFVPIIAYIPSAHIAYSEYVTFNKPELNDIMRKFDREQRSYFERKGKELNYVFADLTQPLRIAAKSGGPNDLLYLKRNLHLSLRGHQVVGEALSGILKKIAVSPIQKNAEVNQDL